MDKDALISALGRLLLSWDGQWFLKVVDEFGLEAGIRLNARVRKSFGKIEMREILRILGKKQAKDLKEAADIITEYLDILGNGAFNMEFTFRNSGECEVTAHRCAALEGSKRANLERYDQPCIACPGLFEAWLTRLLPEEKLEIKFHERMGWGAEKCKMSIKKLASK